VCATHRSQVSLVWLDGYWDGTAYFVKHGDN
jgi:hypothetical protein